jgi:hypothetical protein
VCASPLLHHPRRALAQERAHGRADLAHVTNEFVILIWPQLHDDAHCAAALAVHVSHSLPPAGSARSAAGRVTRWPTYAPRYAPHLYRSRKVRSQSDRGAARTRLYAGYPQYPGKRRGHQKETAECETAVGIAPCSVELCGASAAVNDVKRPWRFGQQRGGLFPFRSAHQERLVGPEVA